MLKPNSTSQFHFDDYYAKNRVLFQINIESTIWHTITHCLYYRFTISSLCVLWITINNATNELTTHDDSWPKTSQLRCGMNLPYIITPSISVKERLSSKNHFFYHARKIRVRKIDFLQLALLFHRFMYVSHAHTCI